MPIASPLRLGALQQGLQSAFLEAAGPNVTVGWAYQEAVYDSTAFPGKGDLINLTMSAGPSFSNRYGASSDPIFPPTSILLSIIPSAGMYVVEVNNQSFRFNASNMSTANNIRDGLLAQITAALDPLTFTAASTLVNGQILLTSNFLGGIWDCRIISPGGNNMTGVATISTNAVSVTSSSRLATITLECFSVNKSPRNGAWNLISKCEACLEDPSYTNYFNDRGFTIGGKTGVADLSRLDSGHWLSRCQFDFDVNMRSVFIRPVDIITKVNLEVDGLGPSNSVVFSVIKP